MKNMKKKIAIMTVVVCLVASGLFVFMEPIMTEAAAVNDSVVVSLTVDSSITITTPDDVIMAPNIGVSSDTSTGTVTWNVKTNSQTGYTLGVKASRVNAMYSTSTTEYFTDYTETVAGTPETWSIAAGAYEFGFSAYGTDVVAGRYGTDCTPSSPGTIEAGAKWEGFDVSDVTVASRATETVKAGIDTKVCFAAAQGTSIYAPAGYYTATITATATEQ